MECFSYDSKSVLCNMVFGTVGKFVFTQNYLQSQKYTLLLIKQILFIILIYYEQFIVNYRNNHILEFNVLKSLRYGYFYDIVITKIDNIN